MVKRMELLAVPYIPPPTLTPSRLVFTVTLVPDAQYFSGRQCALCAVIQCQRPSTSGSVVTCIACSAAALSLTDLLKCTMTGWPTPYVPPSFIASIGLAWNVMPTVDVGVMVLKVLL